MGISISSLGLMIFEVGYGQFGSGGQGRCSGQLPKIRGVIGISMGSQGLDIQVGFFQT